MIRTRTRKDGSKSYGVRIHVGHGEFRWCGTYPTLKEARVAEREAMSAPRTTKMTFTDLAALYLTEAERTKRFSTVQRATYAINAFKADYAHAYIDQITRADAEKLAQSKAWVSKELVPVFNYAVKHDYLTRSPFRGLTPEKSVGRRDLDPLTPEEVEAFAKSAEQAHEAPTLAALIRFGAYTGLRPGELFGLEWRDLDFDNSRVHVRRSMSGAHLGPPKNEESRRQAVILPEGRDALLGLPQEHAYVFPAKRGGRLHGPQASLYYLPPICALFGRKVTLHELRHFCAHHMYVTMDLSARAVAKQLGHSSPQLVQDLYGHWKVGALDEIDRVVGQNVRKLKAVAE